jgi:hypothetical protein
MIICVHCAQQDCDCNEPTRAPVKAPSRCYGCSVHTPGYVVAIRNGAPVHIACLDCNADRSKPLPARLAS